MFVVKLQTILSLVAKIWMTVVNLPMVDGFYMEPPGKALLETVWKKGRHPKKW